ncbi:MAG: GlxA family transcriptional regulator [Myxococcota bacterium]
MHRIAIVVFPGFQPLDLSAPMEVFAGAAEALDRTGATGSRPAVTVVGPPSRSESGLEVVGTPCADVDPRSIDTLIVPGGSGTRDPAALAPIRDWILAAAPHARRVASVCTGAFVLAGLGLLDGHRAATHWAFARTLAERFPAIDVDPDAIFVRSGDRWTSAGVTAGFDLALAMVEDDHGAAIAATIARWLVLPLRRSGGQSQYASELWTRPADRTPIRAVQDHVRTHLDADLSIPALAQVAGMSPRQFQRVFTRDLGIGPAAFVARARLEEARRLLESTRLPVPDVADRCGFGTPEALRRAFVRTLGVPPSTWRAR